MTVKTEIIKGKTDIWVKAAVIGGLWASVEIIIGSFLHNAKLPMAGSTLAFFGTVLLIGFYQIWPDKGLIIRAGLITAIMKSVSPSVIILGPMVGIMLEATLIELAILILGRNFLGFFVAGILSVSSALFYKIISMLLFYGYDLIQVYINIINYALKQLSYNEATPSEVLMALASFYLVMGMLASLLGVLAGRKARKMKSEAKQLNYREIDNNKQDFLVNSDSNTKLAFLIVNILSVPFGLLLINSIYTNVGYIFVFSYMLIFSWIYRKSLRRLRKPFFWIQLVFIVLLSSIFWKDDTGAFGIFKPEGAIAGIEILIRALFIVIAFSGISVELKNKRVEKFLLSLGMGLFYRSISVAFGALPAMITMLPRSKQIIRHPIRSILLPLASADLWLEYFNTEFEKKSSTS